MSVQRFPRRIFRDSMALSVPSGFDRYQNPTTPTSYTITSVHLQAANDTRKTADNTEVTLKGKLWVYPVYSSPDLDLVTLQNQTQSVGGVMTCTVTKKSGTTFGPFTILTVNAYPDDEDNLHHYMLELV